MSLVEFGRSEVERLLGLLDARLQARGVPGSVYVVGGAALAVTVLDARRTVDIDALVSDQVVLEEAHLLAEEERIPRSWLNDDARPWIPPRHPSATVPSTRPVLTIHWAPPEHLLAMKLVAMRPQDVPDIVAPAQQVGLGTDAAAYADLLERVYEREEVLEQLLDVPAGGVRMEALHRGSVAARLVGQEQDQPRGPPLTGAHVISMIVLVIMLMLLIPNFFLLVIFLVADGPSGDRSNAGDVGGQGVRGVPGRGCRGRGRGRGASVVLGSAWRARICASRRGAPASKGRW